jgi:hypothetical protein
MPGIQYGYNLLGLVGTKGKVYEVDPISLSYKPKAGSCMLLP